MTIQLIQLPGTKNLGTIPNAPMLSLAPAPPPGLNITTTSPLPAASQNTAYGQQLTVAGGIPPYTWSTNGAPTGSNAWAVSAAGLLTGTPATVEVDSIPVKVTDSVLATASKTLSLVVNTPSAGTGIFTPAAGVLASLNGGAFTSSAIPGVTVGSVLSFQLSTPIGGKPYVITGSVANKALPAYYCELEYDLSSENVANGRSIDLSRTQFTLAPFTTDVTIGGTLYQRGGLAMQSTFAPYGKAGAAFYQPNEAGAAGSHESTDPSLPGFWNNNQAVASLPWTGFAGTIYSFTKKMISYGPQNEKQWRFWPASTNVPDIDYAWGVNGPGWDNGIPGVSGAGYIWAHNGTPTYGSPSTNFAAPFLPVNTWCTQEHFVKQSSTDTYDGICYAWNNGQAPLFGNDSVGHFAQNTATVITRTTTANSVSSNLVNSFGQLTVNGPSTFGAVAFTSGMTVNSNTWYTYGTDPTADSDAGVQRPYMYRPATSGVSGTAASIFTGADTVTDSNGIVWQNGMQPCNVHGLSGRFEYFGIQYHDDSPCLLLTTTEPGGFQIAQSTNTYARELLIPTAWDATGANISGYVRAAHPPGTSTTLSAVDNTITAHNFGSMQW